jgi:hypothetical protein
MIEWPLQLQLVISGPDDFDAVAHVFERVGVGDLARDDFIEFLFDLAQKLSNRKTNYFYPGTTTRPGRWEMDPAPDTSQDARNEPVDARNIQA